MDGCGSLVDSLITWSIDLSTRTMCLSVLTQSDLQCIHPLPDSDWIITNVGGRVMAQGVSHRPLTPEAGRKEGKSDGWMWELGGLADKLVHRLTYTDDAPQVFWHNQTCNASVPFKTATELLLTWVAVLWLRRLVTGLWPRRPEFTPGSSYVGYVVDEVALWQIFLPVLRFSPVSIIPPWLFILIVSPGGWPSLLVAAVQRRSFTLSTWITT
jgi:hypothetical protein